MAMSNIQHQKKHRDFTLSFLLDNNHRRSSNILLHRTANSNNQAILANT